MIRVFNQICSVVKSLSKLNRFQFIKRKKYTKELNSLQKELLSCDLFELSDAITAYMRAINLSIRKKTDITVKSKTYIGFNIDNNVIGYDATFKYYSITNISPKNTVTYYVYHNTKYLSQKILLEWKPIEPKIRLFYIETIMTIAKSLAGL